MIFSKLLLINTLQRLETQTLGHYWYLGIVQSFTLAKLQVTTYVLQAGSHEFLAR